MSRVEIFSVWGACSDCGYQGLIEYRHVEGEVYDDPKALGVMLRQYCPACESSDNALLPLDYYHELLALAASGEEP